MLLRVVKSDAVRRSAVFRNLCRASVFTVEMLLYITRMP